MTKQKTIKTDFFLEGVGLHSGKKVRIHFVPRDANQGIIFQRVDKHALPILTNIHAISDANFATIIGTNGTSISTTEHLLAALVGLGIDNILIEVDGPEIPIMDGSSRVFVGALLHAGIRELDEEKAFMEVSEPVSVKDGDRWIALYPYNGFKITFTIDYPHPLIGKQRLSLKVTPETFSEKIAFARTFGFKKDLDNFYAMGLAQGGSLTNAIVLDEDHVINPEGLRARDEFVRHKILDLLGDMALLGHPLRGHIVAHKSGHALHHKLVFSLMKQKDHWAYKSATGLFRLPANMAPATV
jgi:UDP-3-O-[3-hydroxymyristoyl] N-acetylglucosamine deacetylase